MRLNNLALKRNNIANNIANNTEAFYLFTTVANTGLSFSHLNTLLMELFVLNGVLFGLNESVNVMVNGTQWM